MKPFAPPPFAIDLSPDRDWMTVTACGELDMATVPRVLDAIRELYAAGFAAFRLDLRQVTFIDSTAVHLLLRLARDPQLQVVIVPGPPAVQRVLDLTGVSGRLPLAPPPRAYPEALRSLGDVPAG
jgi:anti-anti-sigma factor